MTSAGGRCGSTPVDRWVQRLIHGISLAAILAGGSLLWDMKTSNLIIQNDLRAMTERLDDFKLFMGDRYTSSDARRDLTILEKELKDHEDRIRKLEAK